MCGSGGLEILQNNGFG